MSEVKIRETDVTPEWLLSHGFVQYNNVEELGIFGLPLGGPTDLHFVEASLDRNMFVVIFYPSYEHEGHFDHSIYVQDDAGCGFCLIPERWWFLPIEYLQSIYYGIRGEYLSKK